MSMVRYSLVRRLCVSFILLILVACQVVQLTQSPEPIVVAPSPDLTTAPATFSPESASPASTTPSPTATIQEEPFSFSLDAPPKDVSFLIPFNLLHVDETSARFYFELDRPHAGSVFYWDSKGPLRQQEFAAGAGRHLLELLDLQPGVEYAAVVGLRDSAGEYFPPGFSGGEWEGIRFETRALDWEPLRVGVIGDSGFGERLTYQLLEEMAVYDLDFVLHTGDVVYKIYDDPDAPTAFALKYYLPFSPILHRMPVYTVVGNHDVEPASYWEESPYYYRAFPSLQDVGRGLSGAPEQREWLAFPAGDYQILLLNSQAFYGSGKLSAQTAWLEERLRDDRFRYSIVVFHIPPYTSGRYPNDGAPVRSKWVPLFEQANVSLVLSGHDHNYQRLQVNGVTYVISGGGSSSLYPLGELYPGSRAFSRRTHFVYLELWRDRIELTSIALGGEVLDQTTISLASD